jgi:hypothetical protein
MSWVAVAVGGSAAIGAGSSFLSGQASGRAGRQSRDWNNDRFREQRGALGGLAFGGSYLDMMGPNLTPEHRAQLQQFLQQQGLQNGVVGAQQQIANQSQQRGGQILRGYNRDSRNLSGASQGNLDAVLAMYSGLGQQADQWGQGRENIIRRDAGTANKAMDQTSKAQLSASGFGNSTAVANQMQGNATATNRAMQDQLQTLGEAQIDRRLDVGRAGAQARERMGESQINRDYARSAGRSDLQLQNLIRNINLRQAPLNTALGVQQSQVMNPWLSHPQGPGAGVSPLGAAGGTLSSLLAGYGGYLQGQQGGNTLQQQRALDDLDWGQSAALYT